MMIIKTFVGADRYGGQGLFASEDIPAGKPVWRYSEHTTRTYTEQEFIELIGKNDELANTLKRYAYPGIEFLDNKPVTFFHHDLDVSSFMNHCEEPNTGRVPENQCHLYDDAAFINIALRDIKAGEEITYDYFDFHPDINKFRHIETCVSFLLK